MKIVSMGLDQLMQQNTHHLEDFVVFMKQNGKSEATIESYGRDTKKFLTFLENQSISVESVETLHLTNYTESFMEESHNSIRRSIFGIRQFFRFLMQNQQISFNPLDDFILPERDDDKFELPNHSDITAIREIIYEQDSPLKAARDLTLLELLSTEGLKASEIISLQWKHVLFDDNPTGSLKITGKKTRNIKLHTSTTTVFRQYKKMLEDHISDYCFVAFKGKTVHTILPQMTRHGLKHFVNETSEQANIQGISTEALRQFAIHQMILEGWEVTQIMSHLGLKRPGNILKHFKSQNESS